MGNEHNAHEQFSANEQKECGTVTIYSKLINMGCDETVSLHAANKYPNDLNKAIDFLMNTQNNKCDKTIIDNENEIIKNGYLYKQSLHIKKSRKRWLALRGKYLYSYQQINSHEKHSHQLRAPG